MENKISVLTEASDQLFHFTRTALYSFLQHNTWFDGTVYLALHPEAGLSDKNLAILSSIYPNIVPVTVHASPIFSHLASQKRSASHSELLQSGLKTLAFSLPENRIIYFSNKSLFLKDISALLRPNSLVAAEESFSIFYTSLLDSSDLFLTLLENIQALSNYSKDSLSSTINATLSSFPNRVHESLDFYQSSYFSNKKFNQLKTQLNRAKYLSFDSMSTNRPENSKINSIWIQKNQEVTNFLNSPRVSNSAALHSLKSQLSTKSKTGHSQVNPKLSRLGSTAGSDLRNTMRPNKLGAVYIVFDGIELLEKSILQIREHVDYLNVIYQPFSWFNKPIKPEDLKILNTLKELKLIDELTEFTEFVPLTNYSDNSITRSKKYETLKRQRGLNNCLKHDCTHYLCLDVDEFYISSEFAQAKSRIYSEKIQYSACKYINYVTPNLHRGFGEMHVPFICEIDSSSFHGASFITKVDPTRGISTHIKRAPRKIIFHPSEITMHHMETVRIDLYSKYESTSRLRLDRDRLTDLVEIVNRVKSLDSNTINFKKILNPDSSEIKLNSVENIFQIAYDSW